MFRRALVLVTILFSLNSFAQFSMGSGEVSLRGTLVQAKDASHLIVNPKTRAMYVFDLDASQIPEMKKYKSGTKIEVCLQVKEKGKAANTPAEVLKIRPLDPNEAYILYSGKLSGCAKGKGCQNFGKKLPAPALGESIPMGELPADFLKCQE